MSKKGKRLTFFKVFFSLLLFSLFFSPRLFASDYETTSYKVAVLANEDNSFLVNETITVDFLVPKHGIFRVIPYARGKVSVDNVMVEGASFELHRVTSEGKAQLEIKIGDDKEAFTGKKTYHLSYLLRVLDKTNAKDFLYLDLLPSYWDSEIKSAELSLTLPKPIDWSKVNYYSGSYGSHGLGEHFEVKAEGKDLLVKGKNLPAFEGFSVKADLAEGYWLKDTALKGRLTWGLLVLLGLFLISHFILWYRYGRAEKLIPVLSFYPPEGYTALELGYLLDETIDRNKFFSLVSYFAKQGYLKIEQENDNIILHRLCPLAKVYEAEKPFAYDFFTMLFLDESDWVLDVGRLANYEKVTGYTEPTKPLRKERLERAELGLALAYKGDNERLYSASSMRLRLLLAFVLFGFSFLPAVFSGLFIKEFMPWQAYLPSFACGLSIAGFLSIRKTWLTKDKGTLVFKGFFSLGLLGYAFWQQYLIFKTYLFDWLIFPFAFTFFVLLWLIINMEKKEAGNLGLFRELLGFKQFLEVAEKDRLKQLSEKNPTYFYDILPYAYIFNLSSLWIDKFQGIEVSTPNWFYGDRHYERGLGDYLNAIDFLSSNLSSYTESSGGDDMGSSGGGYGGGGGGAW